MLDVFLVDCPGIAGEIARAIDDSLPSSQPAISLPAALTVISTVLCGRQVSACGVEPNLYTCSIADSGTGKTRATHAVTDLLIACGMHQNIMREPASDAGLLRALKDEPRRFLTWDEFGIALEDLAGGKQTHKARLLQNVMSLHSAAGRYFVGQEYSQRSRIDISSPYLNIFAASTGIRFYDALEDKFVHDGFLGRWLTFFSDSGIFYRPTIPFTPQPHWIATLGEIAEGVRGSGNLGDINRAKAVIEIPRAKEYLEEFQRCSYTDNKILALLMRRAYENFVKIAMVVAIGAKKDSSKYAASLVEYLVKREAQEFAESIGKRSARQIAKERFFALVKDQWIAHTDLIRNARRIDATLQDKRGWIAEAIDELEIWECSADQLEYEDGAPSRKKSRLYRRKP